MAVTVSAEMLSRGPRGPGGRHFYRIAEFAVESREDVCVSSGSVSNFFTNKWPEEWPLLCGGHELLNAIRVE